jgi:hypothetical protein
MAKALILRFAGMCGLWLIVIALVHEFALGASTDSVAWSYRVGLSTIATVGLLWVVEKKVG